MVESVREYGQERLNQSEDGAAARTRHLDFYVALAEEAEPELSGRRQGEWLGGLKTELDNLLQALAWCDDAKDGAESGVRLTYALLDFWLHTGLTEVGYQVTLTAVGRAGAACLGRGLSRGGK